MDNLLCDELLQEIFQRLSPSSSSSASLVSKRWLHLLRSSTTSLSLRLSFLHDSTFPSLSSLLYRSPFLSSLRLLLLSSDPAASHRLLLLVSSACPSLHSLSFSAAPLAVSSLLHLSAACTRLTSLSVSLSRPLCLAWVARFPALKDLSLTVIGPQSDGSCVVSCSGEDSEAELGLESLSLTGIQSGDWGLGWLWRSCRRLRKLKLRSCESIGDGGSFSSFVGSGLQEVELRTCRSIVDGVLFKLAANCDSLSSLLIYDGGSREGLLRFIGDCRSNLQKLDFRLPLDLNNGHLSAAAANFRALSSLRLQSCCLVTGEGLKALAIATSGALEELALINCDVVEREPGLLATLGQNLRRLKKLDLSHNEQLANKEFVSMMVSCNNLIELRLSGCKRLTGAAMAAMSRCCKSLEYVDIVHCVGIEIEAVEVFVVSSRRLRRVRVEESKVSDTAKNWVSNRFIEIEI